MPIISFWSANKKETGQTIAAVCTATNMALKHNYKILLVDATFDDDVMERSYWKIMNQKQSTAQLLNRGKIDISSGAEGLVSAVASNKITPEIITNYTRGVWKNRLDVLCGLKTKQYDNFRKSIMLYKDMLSIADKHYDLVFVDLEKDVDKDTTKALLKASHLIIADFTQNYRQFEDYYKTLGSNKDIFDMKKVITLLSNSDPDSKYNLKNVARTLKLKELYEIPYNATLKDAASEGGIPDFFIRNGLKSTIKDKNAEFVASVENLCVGIDKRLKELHYKN